MILFWTIDKHLGIKTNEGSIDKKSMRSTLAVLFCLLLRTPSAFSDESSVYLCRFEGDAQNTASVRMKKYYDLNEKRELGKVDLIQNLIVVESTPTYVIQVPLLDNTHYIQIWNAPTLRVDAQLTYAQGAREFRATYNKATEKKPLICHELRD